MPAKACRMAERAAAYTDHGGKSQLFAARNIAIRRAAAPPVARRDFLGFSALPNPLSPFRNPSSRLAGHSSLGVRPGKKYSPGSATRPSLSPANRSSTITSTQIATAARAEDGAHCGQPDGPNNPANAQWWDRRPARPTSFPPKPAASSISCRAWSSGRARQRREPLKQVIAPPPHRQGA
jgi:hypothetical protein